MNDNAAYVKSQGQIRKHECHWEGCKAQVPPAMWGCKRHWFMLPTLIRHKIWKAYVPGQEITLTPSKEYIDVARETQDWIKLNHPQK